MASAAFDPSASGGSASTLAAGYAAGTSAASSTITEDATRGGVLITAVNLDDIIPLTVNNTNIDTTGDPQGILNLTGSQTIASSASSFTPLSIAYTINQTGTASGAVTGVLLNATETAVLGTHRLLDLQVAGVSKLVVTNTGLLAGSTAASGSLTLAGTTNATKGAVQIGATALATFQMNLTVASAAGAVLDSIKVPAQTITVTGTTGIATAAGFNLATIAAPTITDASACTITNAATLTVLGAPIAAGSAVITNPFALWVQSGANRLDGDTTIFAASGTRTFLTQSNDGSNGLAQMGTQTSSGTTLLYMKSYGSVAAGSSLGLTNANRNFLLGVGDVVLGTASSSFVAISTNVLERVRVTALGNLLLGTSTEVASTRLRVLASQTVASATSAVWDGVDMIASTLTLSGSTSITTATGVNANVFRQPTISAASALSVAVSSTVYIADAPVGAGAGPATLTKKYSLWIDAGLPRVDSTTVNGTVATVLGSVGPVGSSTTVQEWLTIDINGVTRFIPCF